MIEKNLNLFKTHFLSGTKEYGKIANLVGTDPVKACEAAKSMNIVLIDENEYFLRFYQRMKEENKLTPEIEKLGANLKDMMSKGKSAEVDLCNPDMLEGKYDPETQELLKTVAQKSGTLIYLLTEAIDAKKPK